MRSYILLFSCPDKKGIVSGVTSLIYKYSGNLLHMDQHTTLCDQARFFCRCELVFDQLDFNSNDFLLDLESFANTLTAKWKLYDKHEQLKIAILVSKSVHCLHELLHQVDVGDLNVDVSCVISNHDCHRELVQQYNIPFHFIDITQKDKKESLILEYAVDTDCLVLARYMQILSASFLDAYAERPIINIHHSFLPSFKGARPYHQAYDHGVKIIGATSHYVTEKLDEGPIINQVVQPVSHRDTPESLIQKGKYLEKFGLLEAIRLHVEHRVFVFNNRTLIFN